MNIPQVSVIYTRNVGNIAQIPGGFLLSENSRFSLLIVRICDIIYEIMEYFANE